MRDTKPNLTERQALALKIIRDYFKQRSYAPTVREVASQMGIGSPNGVLCHLKALEREGLIRRDERIARGIVLL